MTGAQPAQPPPGQPEPTAPSGRQTATRRWVVEVNEVKVFATGRGADWWTTFLLAAHRTTNRVTEVIVTLGGALCHVACDSRDEATWLAATMVEHGLPRSAVKVRLLRQQGGR